MHLGYAHILAIVNCAAMNVGVHELSKLVFSLVLDIYPGVQLLDPTIVLFSVFEEPPHCFP